MDRPYPKTSNHICICPCRNTLFIPEVKTAETQGQGLMTHLIERCFIVGGLIGRAEPSAEPSQHGSQDVLRPERREGGCLNHMLTDSRIDRMRRFGAWG